MKEPLGNLSKESGNVGGSVGRVQGTQDSTPVQSVTEAQPVMSSWVGGQCCLSY